MPVKQIMVILIVIMQLTENTLIGIVSCPTRTWREYILHASKIASSKLSKLFYKYDIFVLHLSNATLK